MTFLSFSKHYSVQNPSLTPFWTNHNHIYSFRTFPSACKEGNCFLFLIAHLGSNSYLYISLIFISYPVTFIIRTNLTLNVRKTDMKKISMYYLMVINMQNKIFLSPRFFKMLRFKETINSRQLDAKWMKTFRNFNCAQII